MRLTRRVMTPFLKGTLKAVLPNLVLDVIGASRHYRAAHGTYPNLFLPKTFSEKVLHRAIFDHRPLLRTCADKYAVRGFVEQVVGADILPKLYYLASDPRDIPFMEMPDRFAVKPTHGSGWVTIVRDKSTLDVDNLVDRCDYWLSQDYAHRHHERNYRNIPRRIIVEELIDDGTEGGPVDYKFFVFHGKVEMIGAIFGRFSDCCAYLCDRNWSPLGVGLVYPSVEKEVAPPKQLKELIRIAELLGKELAFVRVDLYATGKRIVFGELTTTPGAGLDTFHPQSFDAYLGSLW